MSKRLFQEIIRDYTDVVDREIGIVDASSVIMAASDISKVGNIDQNVRMINNEITEAVTIDGYTYKLVLAAQRIEYVVFVEGSDELAKSLANVIAISIDGIKKLHDEKFDRGNFIKNVILDNILPSDIYVKARELHFNSDVTRVVLLIRANSTTDISAFDILKSIFPDEQQDFLFTISEDEILLIKEVKPGIEAKYIELMGESIVDILTGEYLIKASVGIGTMVNGVKELAGSYKEAQTALEVGKVFDTEKTVVCYENLGIARLIYQLPTTLCDMFLREVFKMGSIESLDYETLFTIQKFFENNLNVSETSRKLFVHRNTLVYRLEKIKKLTGLDLREFDHAIVFKVALMVKKYLTADPVKY